MMRLLDKVLISPKEAGVEKYTAEEIAEKMKPLQSAELASMSLLAAVVTEVFEGRVIAAPNPGLSTEKIRAKLRKRRKAQCRD